MQQERSVSPELNSTNYINRELSWIEFAARVLAQAKDESLPLLERLKFIAIVSSITDEFFMVRVAAVQNKVKLGVLKPRPDGLPYPLLLNEISSRIRALAREQRAALRDILAGLESAGVALRSVAELEPSLQAALRDYFTAEVFPILTPLAVDHARPFPFISNLSLNLAVLLHREQANHRNGHHKEAKDANSEEHEFVRLKIPDMLPRLLALEDVVRKYGGGQQVQTQFVWIEDVIAHNLDLLFPGMTVLEYAPFRVTRNADIDFENEREFVPGADISDIIEEGLRERRFGSLVRLSVPEWISKRMLDRLVSHMPDIDPQRDVYQYDGALGLASLFALTGIDRHDLKLPPFMPRLVDGRLNGEEAETESWRDLFSAIRARDRLLHHPYDSFAPVEEFFRAAAHDPDVLAIKATLYRVGRNSPVVQALLEARDNDKQVAVLVELKARFDEENNLEWARALEEKGVHVTYGVEELPIKTHAKIAMVVRREGDSVRRYVHLGTGNYNASTARSYTDLGVFTCNREIADDATRLFNRLTGFAPATSYNRLLVAPEYLQGTLLSLIDGEIAAARAGLPARLIFKMNQLEEDVMIRKLYEASQAGVRVDLLVRGLCCLRPGIPGVSDNIRVISIIGRFLEHSRVFYFHNAPPQQRIFLGSADLMRRNLYNRVEIVFPVLDERLQQRVLRVLATALHDTAGAWELLPDDSYRRIQPAEGEAPFSSQAAFIVDSFGLNALP